MGPVESLRMAPWTRRQELQAAIFSRTIQEKLAQMRLKGIIAGTLGLVLMAGFAAAPSTAAAQSSASRHRQQTKNEWRNLAYAGGAIGLLGLLNHDSTMTFLGTAGALYSANRYEQDRKSQSRMDRARAYYFHRGYFRRNGHSYRRYTTYRNGRRYWYFKRVD